MTLEIAVPASASAGLTPTLTGTGIFNGLTFTPSPQFGYVHDNERIFTWAFLSSTPISMSWTANVLFTGLIVTFTNGTMPSQVKLVDFANLGFGGGDDQITYFDVETS